MTNAYPTLTFYWMCIEVLIRSKYAVYVFLEATTPERKNISRESEAFSWSGSYKLATVHDSDTNHPQDGQEERARRGVEWMTLLVSKNVDSILTTAYGTGTISILHGLFAIWLL